MRRGGRAVARLHERLDSILRRSYHRPMPMWRCPHCGTPQAEAARCWVCRRSSTSCATCRNFRHSVAIQVGYCGIDRGRSLLAGDEIRPCWEARPVLAAKALPVVPLFPGERTFVEPDPRADPPTRFWADADA